MILILLTMLLLLLAVLAEDMENHDERIRHGGDQN